MAAYSLWLTVVLCIRYTPRQSSNRLTRRRNGLFAVVVQREK